MFQRTRGRRAALASGIFVMALAVAVGLSWHRLAVQYHLWRLRAEPEHAFELVGDGESTSAAAEEALARFLATDEGRGWFLGEFWKEVVEPTMSAGAGPSRRSAGMHPRLGVVWDQGTGKAMALWKTRTATLSISRTPADYDRARRCFALLRRMTCSRVPLESAPEWRVSVLEPTESHFRSLDVKARFSVIPEGETRYCVVERGPGE